VVADVPGGRHVAAVETTKAARDLCRAAFGDELPDIPVPFITWGFNEKEGVAFRTTEWSR
jgi:hypothetical protein